MAFRGRLKCRPKSVLIWTLAAALLYFCYHHVFPLRVDPRDVAFNEHDKCPACFGESLCPDLFNEKLVLANWSRFSASRLFNAKNVYRATHRGAPVIVKKLAHDPELKQLDTRICELFHQRRGFCHVGHYMRFFVSEAAPPLDQGRTLDYTKINNHEWTEALSCMRSQKLLDILISHSRHHKTEASLENILTLLMLNPEPLIFMSFPAEEGWPFPEYLGSCGRLAVFEDCGDMLTDYYLSPWTKRVQLARQLVQMAARFTSNEAGVALYLTDWSADNFAVDQFGKLRLVDAENVVLVDQTMVKEVGAPGASTRHNSDGMGCKTSFCYASEDLCTHAESDHNFYGVCKGLLSEGSLSAEMPKGLLHSIPSEVLRKHPLLPRLLQECAEPSHPGGRFEAVKELAEILSLL